MALSPQQTMGLSLIVSTADPRIVWVSEGFAEGIGLPTDKIIGRPLSDLLDFPRDATWTELFSASEFSGEQVDRTGIHLVGDAESVDRLDLRSARYIDGGDEVSAEDHFGRHAPERTLHSPGRRHQRAQHLPRSRCASCRHPLGLDGFL